ncbi:MAG: nucleotidyltransferase domain-containing protein [Lachnobacterium sp.]|nr:nucleotidyltransferase domain-containing protein [Lachnobacterium sp.]MDD6631517.1 nucleotidyltransferase domain-containing protein [Lachnobacterium sp.]MDY2911465.1 nucleotidyltransferase domain-containing protein [Agathobacter sp.]
MGRLKDLRLEKRLTQQQVADLVGISLRSYKSYENDETKIATIKYNYIMQKLEEINPIDEEHGIIDIEYIRDKCQKVFEKYDVDFCYLFGSYAKNKATPTSDVDLLISAKVKGLKFYGLVEEVRTALHKKVDVLDVNQLNNNMELTQEILKDGIKIYG